MIKLREFILERDFRMSGGGTCEWTTGRTAKGERVFMKRFLSPTYPLPEAPGSDATKARKRRECDLFEHRQRYVTSRIAKVSMSTGACARTIEVFRSEAHYYKVTEWVDGLPASPAEVSSRPVGEIARLLLVVGQALYAVHKAGLVHGDLKPDNIMVEHGAVDGHGRPLARLIDFDSAYPAGRPLSPGEVGGDPVYFSPELLRYVRDGGSFLGRKMTPASDVFSLGLIIHQYLTGELPGFDRGRFKQAAQSVVAGVPLEVKDGDCGVPASELVRQMIVLEPSERPPLSEVAEVLRGMAS